VPRVEIDRSARVIATEPGEPRSAIVLDHGRTQCSGTRHSARALLCVVRMRVAWVGGLDRSAPEYVAMAAQMGHQLEIHNGGTGGRGSRALRGAIARSDLVVLITDINSHGALSLARRVAREEGKRVVLLRRCGVAKFKELLGGTP
jgi:hypothetical protein